MGRVIKVVNLGKEITQRVEIHHLNHPRLAPIRLRSVVGICRAMGDLIRRS